MPGSKQDPRRTSIVARRLRRHPVWCIEPLSGGSRDMTLAKGIRQLLAEAEGKAPAISVEEARKLHGDPGTVFVDIRDVRELEREGMIPGAFHAPRGMLEFWVDPESPYHKPVFAED